MKTPISNYEYNAGDVVTAFYLNPCKFDLWVKQNNASYTGNYFPGCLLDNFVMDCKRGYAFFYEHYVNSNASDYIVYFIPYKAGEDHEKEYDLLWAEFIEKEDLRRED